MTQDIITLREVQNRALTEIRKLCNFFAKERELCGSCSWTSFSRAKGNHRWITSYASQAASIKPENYANAEDYLYALKDCVKSRNIIIDADYEWPKWAMEQVEESLEEILAHLE